MCAGSKPSLRCVSQKRTGSHRASQLTLCARVSKNTWLISIEQIKRTEALIRNHVKSHPGLQRRSELRDSIPVIAETTAALLLAEITDSKQSRRARQVAADAGLVPRERQSGSSVRGRTRLSKIGNARLRRALYFPAITALRCSPFFQAWAKGLQERGKSKMRISGAVRRKLVHLVYGVWKTGKPFDPEWAKIA